MTNTIQDLITGTWTYRSFLNNPVLSTDFDALEFGRGNLALASPAPGVVTGKIYGTGWELKITGSVTYGNPATLWLQGSGIVGGAPWVYDYLCYVVPHIANGINQVPAFVGRV